MKVVKIFAVAAGSIAALFIVAAIIIAWLFDPNDYKDYVTAWLEEQTGRSWAVEDDLELSFFPWLAVETGGIAIGNAPGFEQRPFAAIDRVSVRVRLVPLLSNEIDIGTVMVDGLDLDLALDANGRANWEDLIAREGAAPTSDPNTASEGIGNFDIEGLVLRGARVVWRENADGPRFVVSEMSLETGSFSPSRPVDVALQLDLLDVATQLTAQLQADATLTVTTDGSVSGSDLEFSFALTDGSQDERASGELQLEEFSVSTRGELQTGGFTVSSTLFDAPVGPSEMSVGASWGSASASLEPLEFTVNGLQTSVAGIDADWRISGTSLDEAPNLNGTVTVANAPVESLLALLSIDPPTGTQSDELGVFSASTNFSMDIGTASVLLSNTDANVLGINVRTDRAVVDPSSLEGQVVIAPFRPNETIRAILAANLPADVNTDAIERLSFRGAVAADFSTGVASLSDVEAELLGAVVSGDLSIGPAANGARYTGSVTTNRFESDQFIAVLDALLTDTVNADELGNILLAANFTHDTGTDTANLSNLRLEAFGLNAAGQLDVRNVSSSPVLSGQARVADFPPRDLLRRFGQTPPQASDETVLRNASIETQFNITPALGRFSNLVLALDDSRISGSFSVDDFNDPSYRFELNVDAIDVDRYLPPQTEQADDDDRRAGDIALSSEPLETLRINGQVNVGVLRLAQMNFQNVATGITVGGGRMNLESARASLYGGEFDGAFRVDTTQDLPSLSLQGRAQGLELEPLIRALTGDANFSGTADFDIDLTGRGATVTDTLHTAAGQMGFTLRNGAIDGFNVEHMLCGYYNSLRQLPDPDQNQPDRTRYDLIQGTAAVSDGIAASDDLLAQASSMEVRGSGRLSLVEQLADYTFEAQFSKSVDIMGCESMDRLIGLEFPLTLTGSVTDPTVQPDYSAILERWARDEVEDRVRDELEERLLDIFR